MPSYIVNFTRMYVDETYRPPGIEMEANKRFASMRAARRFIRAVEEGLAHTDIHGNLVFDYAPTLGH
jgi:hypothetical protein